MAKITSQQCYRLAVTPGMFLDQFKKKIYLFCWDFIKSLHFFVKWKKHQHTQAVYWTLQSLLNDGYSDSMSEYSESMSEHSCLIILRKKSKRVLNSTSTLWPEAWNQTISVTIFSSLKSSGGSYRLNHSECLNLLMTTELLMSQQKVKNGLWANVNWNTFHSSQSWDIHSEWKNSSTVLVWELLARLVVSWWRL